MFLMLVDLAVGSSAPSGYSGSAFTSIPAIGSLPVHSNDVAKSTSGEPALFTGQVGQNQCIKCVSVMQDSITSRGEHNFSMAICFHQAFT